ncbi:MAG TPA: bifunctional diguanylate cyclase/phosphodiesterase [Pyrinomonadaceae bacterium]|jgi:diguanylate cyclase (GGDEF)-like protein|nr:bifunctional diguanylate cyclase/phosphodiesterase [Pyrinomonadaceae bacterium]
MKNIRKQLPAIYMWAVIAAGAASCAYAGISLPVGRIDIYFWLLTVVTAIIGSRIAIRIPKININITVDDTFVFIALLLYGRDAAVLLAAMAGICSGLRISKKVRTVAFGGAALACAILATGTALRTVFGPATQLFNHGVSFAVTGLCLMGLVQYLVHTGLGSIASALKAKESVWHMWSRNFLWISISYFAGAAAAGFIVSSVGTARFWAFLVVIPIIIIVYFSYDRYMREVKASARQAEEAERARAESEHERAEQAERHVQELNNYIVEQERISRVLEETKDHFRHAAFHDSLTGLPNRGMFTELLKAEIESSNRSTDHLFAVLFLDLDRFKNVNDSLGHTFGDLLLVAFAERLERTLRPVDTLARFGGDEFAILLSGITDTTDAVRVAERIHAELSLPFDLDRSSAFATASIGIALSSSGYDRPDDILRDADIAMYRAKENGKARYEMFDHDMHARAVTRLQLESDLRQAVEQKQFAVYYQPIMSLETGRLAGFEALVRWNHPRHGVVAPADFIPAAEETGLIVPIGQWVLEEACKKVREWQVSSPGHRNLSLSVNLAARQISQPDLTDRIKSALEESKLHPHSLKLELTESVVMENAEAAAQTFKQLRSLGVQLSIDDFGTGYSSLSYLHRFPLNYLKIDRSFVMRMTRDNDNAIVKTISTLAHNLGMEVIAEGIETEEQYQQLKNLGCEFGQGYLFSRPVDAEGALNLLTKDFQRETAIEIENLPDGEAVVATLYSM